MLTALSVNTFTIIGEFICKFVYKKIPEWPRLKCLLTKNWCAYDKTMYKNTVSNSQNCERVVVRIREGDESDTDVFLSVDACTKEGVRTLVFPSESLLSSWRQRLEALA